MPTKVRLYQVATEGAVPGQVVGLVDGEWAPYTIPPPDEGGAGGSGFFDDFEREDIVLEGDNGWFRPTAHAGSGDVATFYIEDGVVKQTLWGQYPILHDRMSDNTDVADVECEIGFDVDGDTGGYYVGLCVCSDETGNHGLMLWFDGSAYEPGVNRMTPDGVTGGSVAWTNTGWHGWSDVETTVMRLVYTESTQTLDVYQEGVLVLTGDVSDVGGGFYVGEELPALTTMPYAGPQSYADTHWHTFDNFSTDGCTTPGGCGGGPAGPVLDDMLDVDTTTVPPDPNQFLKYDAGLELWVPADLPSSTTGAPFEITDTPPDPPPYAGYAYMSLDFKVRIWSGTEWRQISTVHYTPPGEGEEVIMLDSLVGRYRALGLEYADGDPVDTWLDTSGLDNHLTTHTAGIYEADGIGGLPSVMFNRGTWYSMPAPVARPVTVVGVMRSTDSSTLHSILFGNDAADSYPYFGMIGGVWRLSDGGSTYVDQAVVNPLDAHIMYGRASVDGMMNGADGAKTTTVATMGFKPQNLGYWWINNSYSMLGPVSEMLVYNEALTDEQLDAIIHQLGLVYGITTSV